MWSDFYSAHCDGVKFRTIQAPLTDLQAFRIQHDRAFQSNAPSSIGGSHATLAGQPHGAGWRAATINIDRSSRRAHRWLL